MRSKQEGRRGQSAVFSVFNIRRRAKAAGGGGAVIMRAALIASLAAALVFAGCRGGDSEDYVIENPPSVDSPIDSLKINPPNASVVIGGSQQFTVTPGDSKVIWKVDGQESSDTAIDTNNGELLIADDETAPTIIISASLEADSSKKATAAVTIMRLADCFSNAAGGLEGNSAIDVIQGTKLFGQPFVHILLTQDTETVDLGASDQDINGGLVLTATGDSPNSPAEVVIDGGGREITLSSTGTFPVITVETGVTLTLRNITLTGNNSNNAPLIKVDGGMLVLEDGAHITGNTNTAGNGGGVYVTGGTFDMNGGTISGNTASNTAADNYGGGVYVTGGTFNMTGGTISGNTSTSTSTNTDTAITVGSGGGGVYAAGGSTFEMTGGAISGNTASNTSTETGTETTSGSGGGGVYAAGGSTFEMTGGAISGNKATSTNDKITVSGGGVYFAGSACTMTNANITKNTANSLGGGVYFAGSACTMTNANITENTAGLNSGGVYVSSGTFKMDGGAISGNTATRNTGGGVYVNDGTFDMTGGEISGNKAPKGSGGGVYVASGGTFDMNNAHITNNEAGNNGGGVIVYGAFTMAGSEISGNTAKWGGGVCLQSEVTFEMTDGTISKNSATGTAANDGGGGVAVYTGEFIMTGGTISDNKAPNGAGGGIVIGDSKAGTVTMTNANITGNNAGTNGGGVYVKIGTFTMTGGTIYGTDAEPADLANTASKEGAALFKAAAGVATLNGENKGTAEVKIDGNIP